MGIVQGRSNAIVAGKVEQAINEAIGDIIPGAHVAVVAHQQVDEAWVFHITLPAIPPVYLTDQSLAVNERWLQDLIGAAEDAVQLAKARMLAAWGIENPGEGVPGGE